VVAQRITARLDGMLAAGFVEEVRSLSSRNGGWSRTARQALGYRELASHVELGVPLAEAVAQADQHTRRFSVRQRSWWRRDPRIKWFESHGEPLALADEILRDWEQT
jgi:tRNA dimethylallyltransferase